jgi:uncharacterized protein DUF932
MSIPSLEHPRTLAPSLQVAPDMLSTWSNVELDFDTAAERLVRAHEGDGAPRDLPITNLTTWVVAPAEGKLALAPLARHHPPMPLRANGFANLAARLGAPVDFLKRLPAPLQLATLNYLLLESNDESAATLRLRGNEVTAIVSGRYAPLDATELVDAVRSGLVKHGLLGEARVRSVASGLVDNLRLVFPSEERAVKPGDVSSVGLDIVSSSFARSAVHVSPVVWRLVCSNGLKRAERKGGLSFRHVGDAQRLREGVAEAIPAAMVQARGVLDQWRRAVDFMVDDVAKQIEALRELTTPERKNVEDELRRELDRPGLPETVPLFDLVNAMTASAKLAPPARRLELEAVAGDVLARHLARS